jgi:hypothetical protein
MMTVPMHTLPSAERCHHRWPPWARLGLVMKPFAGRSASVTPLQSATAALVAAAAAVVGVAALDRPAVT